MSISVENIISHQSCDTYFELVQRFPLVSIRSDEHLELAKSFLQKLFIENCQDEGTTTYIDTLSDLMGVYEDEHYPIAPPSEAEMLKHFMDAQNVTTEQLCHQTGIDPATIHEVLVGHAKLPDDDTVAIAKFFQIEPGVLVRDTL